jgi:hypothetical protein
MSLLSQLTGAGGTGIQVLSSDPSVDQILFSSGANQSPQGIWMKDGSGVWSPVGPIVLARLDGSLTAVLTTSNQDVVTALIPAGMLGTPDQGRILRFTLYGVFINNGGANRQIIPTIAYGATNLWSDAAGTTGTGLDAGMYLQGHLTLNGTTGTQAVAGVAAVDGTAAVTIGTTGDLGSDEIAGHAVLSGVSSVDSTVDQTFRISVRASGVGTQLVVRSFLVELV